MKVYHGSYTVIEDIDLSKSIPNKDFGKGFYVTKYRQHAESWAKAIGRKFTTNHTKFSINGTKKPFALGKKQTRELPPPRHY